MSSFAPASKSSSQNAENLVDKYPVGKFTFLSSICVCVCMFACVCVCMFACIFQNFVNTSNSSNA